jgi:cysteine-rich repeat protein
MATARSARAGWLAASVLAAACFKDDGLPPLESGGGTSTGGPLTSSSTAEPSSGPVTTTSGEGSSGEPTTDPPAVCGNNVIEAPVEVCDDGNTIDTDACRADCMSAASCGDGVVWEGKEECDAGAANHPTLPDACRPGCVLPKCGDGAIYVGALGPPIDIGGGPGTTVQSDDGPRAIGALADGTFSALWRSDADADQLFVQRLAADGQPTGVAEGVLAQFTTEVRDPVLAVAGDGDMIVAWEISSNNGDLRARTALDGGFQNLFTPHQVNGGIQDAISLGLADTGAAAAAFLGSTDGDTYRVYLRHFPAIADPGQAPGEQIISDHVTGVAHPPTVAMRSTGEFVVAWGEPAGLMTYRRFAADGAPVGSGATSELRVGGGNDGQTTKQWTGVALRADASVALVGVDVGGHLALQLFDAVDAPAGSVQVAETDARFFPYIDVAADAVGNLTVAWVACGAPGDVAPSCVTLQQVGAARWFYADLTPFGPQTQVFAQMQLLAPATPIGLAVAPGGAAAVTWVEGNRAYVRVAPVSCP